MTTQNTTPAAAAPATTTIADDFESVFAEITRDETDPAKPAAAAAAPAGTGDGEAAGAAGEGAAAAATTATDPAAPAAGDAAAVAAAAATAAAAAAAGDEPDELAEAQARIAELEAAVAAKEKPAAETTETTETPAATTAADDADDPVKKIQWRQPNEKEAAVLQNFGTEWPEVAEALKVQSQIDIFNAVQYVFAMMQKEYAPRMKQFEQVSEAVGELLTLTDLRGRNSDYDELYDNVVNWTDNLSSFQKKAAKQVLESGTPDEVTELFAEYRKANPTKPALVAGTPAAPQAPKGKTELTAAAKKAANALSVVDSKRTSATTAVDPNDFDAAWREANSGS